LLLSGACALGAPLWGIGALKRKILDHSPSSFDHSRPAKNRPNPSTAARRKTIRHRSNPSLADFTHQHPVPLLLGARQEDAWTTLRLETLRLAQDP
jgi:hypothetical protein